MQPQVSHRSGRRPAEALSATLSLAVATLAIAGSAHAATLVASYGFNNTLASSVGGPALTAVDPAGASGFATDTVFGATRTVYQVGGTATPANQGGLVFDGAGLLNNTDGYSLELTLQFTDPTRNNTWRRLVDTLDRTSDAGFYADPGNRLDVYPVAGSDANILANAYRNIVLTVQGDQIHAYIDSGTSLSATSTVLDLQGSNLISLFLDNTAGGGQGEWSTANIATLNVFSGVLTEKEAEAFNGEAFTAPMGGVPEPATWAMMIVGFGLAGATLRGRRGASATPAA